MSRKRVWVVVAFMAVIVGSAGVGYLTAWTVGYARAGRSHAMTHCDMLLLESGSLIRGVDTSGLNGLIDAIETNGNVSDGILRAWQLCARADDNERISRALARWEMAKKKLEQLRRSHETSEDPNSGGTEELGTVTY
jgi:hypothetical protein